MSDLSSQRIALYCRTSGDEQREKGTIQTQREFGQRYAELQGIGLVEIYADDGVRGKIPLPERPEGARLLRDARRGHVAQVWLYKLDRIGRKIRVILEAVDLLERAGCTVRSLTEPFDTSTAAGRFVLAVMAGAAELERDNIAERTLEGLERAVRDGVWVGAHRLYGYQIAGKGRDCRLVIDPAEAEVVRLMYRLYVHEGLSTAGVAQRLNELGIPTMHPAGHRTEYRNKKPTAGLWVPGRIYTLLSMRAYCGTHEWGKESARPREIISRAVPAIIDVETWERAQALMEERRTYAARNGRHDYLLRGMIRCRTCHGKYYGSTQGAYRYYRCRSKEQAPGCPSKAVPADTMENLIWKDVEAVLKRPEPVLAALRKKLEHAGVTETQRQKEGERLEATLAKKAAERERILRLWRRELIDDGVLEQQLAEIARDEIRLQAERERERQQAFSAAEAQASLAETGTLLRALRSRLGEGIPDAERRRIIELLVDRIEVESTGPTRADKAILHVLYTFQIGEHEPVTLSRLRHP